MTNTKTTKAVIPATELNHCMEAIQTDILQGVMENAAEYFWKLEMPYLGKAQTCEEALMSKGLAEDTLFPLDLALSRYVSIIAWHVYRQGLKEAMQKPALAEALLRHTSDDEPPAPLEFPSPLYAYDTFVADHDRSYYRLKRPEEFAPENI